MRKLAAGILAGFLVLGSGKAQISSFPWIEDFEGGSISGGIL